MKHGIVPILFLACIGNSTFQRVVCHGDTFNVFCHGNSWGHCGRADVQLHIQRCHWATGFFGCVTIFVSCRYFSQKMHRRERISRMYGNIWRTGNTAGSPAFHAPCRNEQRASQHCIFRLWCHYIQDCGAHGTRTCSWADVCAGRGHNNACK